MWQRLVVDHDLVVAKETAKHTQIILDLEGVKTAKASIQRRGPNFLWHNNGFDKLKPFGFCIHGRIDHCNRRIV